MHELGVFISKTARTEYKEKGRELARKAGAQILNPTFPVNIPNDIETVVGIGGNGSIKGIMEGIIKKNHPINLLVVPGGSQNGFYRSVNAAGATISDEQLIDGSVDGVREFNPPSVNGELFNHGAGFGKNVAIFEHLDEQLRTSPIPKDIRSIVAGLFAVAANIKDDSYSEYVLQIASPGSFLGRFRTFPDQDVFSNDLTFAKIKGGTRKEIIISLARIFFSLAMRSPIPEDLVDIEKSDKFELIADKNLNVVNADGRIIRFELGSRISISRGTKSVNVAALTF